MPLNIGLVYDLRRDYTAAGFPVEIAAEFDSDETIDALDAAIRSLGHAVDRVGNARTLCARLVEGQRWDLVFNIAEGLAGRCRESQVPAVLELFNVPYTFSDPLVLAATLDKAVAKRLIASARVATPKFAVVETPADATAVKLDFPLFAKPLAEGSGKGIGDRSIASNGDELLALCCDLIARFNEPVLVEEYLPGREFTVGILGTGAAARALGTIGVEIVRDGAPAVYSYQNKELCEKFVRYTPLQPGRLRKSIEKLALAAYRILECRDAARVDVRLDKRDRPSFLEVNPLPGLHPTHSDLPMIATSVGMSYRELIGAIIDGACSRLGISV